MLIGIAFLFLAVCLVNTVGLLLAKFLNARRRRPAPRARREPRDDLPPAPDRGLLIGVAGGSLGLGSATAVCSAMRQLYNSVRSSGRRASIVSRPGDARPRAARRHPGGTVSGVAHRPHGAGRLPEDAVTEESAHGISSHHSAPCCATGPAQSSWRCRSRWRSRSSSMRSTSSAAPREDRPSTRPRRADNLIFVSVRADRQGLQRAA